MNLKKPRAIEPRISRRLDLLGKRFCLATVESCKVPLIQQFTLTYGDTTIHAKVRLIIVE